MQEDRSSSRNGSLQNGSLQNASLQNASLQNGTFQNGTFQNGTFQNGTFRNGTFQNGTFRNGTFRNGTFRNGTFRNGLLVGIALASAWPGGCSYRLPELPTSDAAIDAGAFPASCAVVRDVGSPSCPVGAARCERVTIVLPAGPWTVGPNSFDPGATASFEARGARTIALDAHEVDVARFRRFVASSGFTDAREVPYPDGSRLRGRGAPAEAEVPANQPLCTYGEDASSDTLPVNCVSWEAALAFCAFDGGRLPTLAELEYVRRWWPIEGLDAPGSDGRLYPWGDDEPSVRFGTPLPPRFAGGPASMGPIDPEQGPRIGCLEGIAGGVTEWLADAAPSTLDDPCYADGLCEGPADHRFVATGAWDDLDPEWMRSSAIAGRFPTERIPGQGFRCVYDLE